MDARNGSGHQNGSGNQEFQAVEEQVTYTADSSHIDRFIPRISVSQLSGKNVVEKRFRPFEADDMARVLDFTHVTEQPPDGSMMYCEDAGKDGLRFPVRHCCVRGGFLFYFDVEAVDDQVGHFATFEAPPLGVVPLDKISVEFPPGGRRVFREHAHTDARNGYELVILHVPEGNETARPPTFLVAESLGLRERWAKALRDRADVEQPTMLRAEFATSRAREALEIAAVSSSATAVGSSKKQPRNATGFMPAMSQAVNKRDSGGPGGRSRVNRRGSLKTRDADDKVMYDGDDAEVENAVREFGSVNFSEKKWIDEYFGAHNDFDAPTRGRQLEQWQASIKRSLKGAVLEQYEYFVEASGEMKTMGMEVNSLKTLVETQVETIKEMKEIDFMGALFNADQIADEMEEMDSDEEDGAVEPGNIEPRQGGRSRRASVDDANSVVSSVSSMGEESAQEDRGVRRKPGRGGNQSSTPSIEIPSWLEDVGEEISAFVKECRYTDATELLFKAKHEVNDIFSQHEKSSERTLTKKQVAQLQNTLKTLDAVTERMSNRLAEGLRRKNEALKQASKRERSDPHSLMAPLLSPCCLNDDLIPLQLLVRLGKTQEAATAYAARRSLLLLESLHERPISGTGNVDLVIYAAQLSQSFFSCLANAVEGFLDLFLSVSPNPSSSGQNNREDSSYDGSSLHSHSSKNVPPGALASIVLWCDSELSKFASAFGGSRVLGNLPLSPPPRNDGPRQPRVLGADSNGSKERQNAIDVATQCVAQAFLYASENLDSIGLPLTPRLADYIRSRLKGCEAEVSAKLDDRWKHITLSWETEMNFDEMPLDDRRGIPMIQPSRSNESRSN